MATSRVEMVKRDFVRGGIDTVTEPVTVVTRDGRTLGIWFPGEIEEGTHVNWMAASSDVGGTYVSPATVTRVRLKPTPKDPAWLKGGR